MKPLMAVFMCFSFDGMGWADAPLLDWYFGGFGSAWLAGSLWIAISVIQCGEGDWSGAGGTWAHQKKCLSIN